MSLLYALCGAICGALFVPLFNRLPARWLCDFGEQPSETLPTFKLSKRAYAVTVLPLALAFFLLCAGQGAGLPTAALCAATFLAALCAAADLKNRIVPVELCIAIAAVSPFHIRPLGWAGFASSLVGGAVLGGSFLLIGVLGSAVYKKEAMGFGDVYFAAALGLYFEHFYAFAAFFLTLLLAGAYFILLILLRKFDRSRTIAFAPFIGGAFTLYFCFEKQFRQFFSWYLQLLGKQ